MPRKAPDPTEHSRPVGTMALMLLYFILILVLWGSVYLTLLERGVTR
ncbi:MAG: cytochrome c oxidase subunit 2A [Anaerolineae bacterium]|nr:cytochrome c oxidase subunit 2A [Caldilineales bacterium]MCX7851719.1 cytochrome c oxidase subunit 2A [Caldilineales bacterium]MDW8268139.1 cytochrome c oxidase subunit 2A [Anaerolineae bacterium]